MSPSRVSHHTLPRRGEDQWCASQKHHTSENISVNHFVSNSLAVSRGQHVGTDVEANMYNLSRHVLELDSGIQCVPIQRLTVRSLLQDIPLFRIDESGKSYLAETVATNSGSLRKGTAALTKRSYHGGLHDIDMSGNLRPGWPIEVLGEDWTHHRTIQAEATGDVQPV